MALMGRTSAIEALVTALEDCTAGGSRIVWIEGATGCGKSALADALAERAAADGVVVLSAVACAAERGLPLGVVRQLVHSDGLFTPPAAAAHGGAPSRVEDMQAFCAALRELGADHPAVLLLVDDVEHADEESLRHLEYIARHARSAKVLMVVTGSLHADDRYPVFVTELMRQPHFRRIRLGRLSPADVAEMLGHPAGDGESEPVAGLHRISGGNPLLLRALAEEHGTARSADGAALPAPAPAGPFARAVATCLHRGGPAATGPAQAAALLGEQATPARIARLLGLGSPAVDRGLHALEAAGILDGTGFRHPVARAAALAALEPQQLAELHRRAAKVVQEDGGSATDIAAHLLAAAADGVPRHGSAADVDVLRDAAEDVLARDDAPYAERLLELAHETCGDDQLRVALRIRLAQITGRFSPAAAERHLTASLEALPAGGAGRPAGEHVQRLASLLITQGRIAEATELLRNTDDGQDPGLSPFDTTIDAGFAVSERLLQSARLTDATVAPLAQALRSLIISDQPERAVPWSRSLMEQADRCRAPGWGAVFASLHAEALLRLGDLPGAHAHATAALQYLPDAKGSAFQCAPTAVLIRACSAMGRYTEGSRHAERQIPQRHLTTVHGLGLLRARGLHQLAVGQPHAALSDFLEVGRWLESWEADRPAFLPWRTDAAEALLRLGKPQQAERLVLQQLSLPDARRPWVRGVSLRLRAMTAAPEQRPALLRQSIDELQRSGDRLETARAMAELGRALQADGSASKGSAMIRTAWNLAKECQAIALCREILPDAPLSDPSRERTVPAPGDTSGAGRLSSSEQRVATLAAQGLTNREISAKLYLTVSTVEQHLTRVYRKLQISCRGDLPMDLELGGRVTV